MYTKHGCINIHKILPHVHFNETHNSEETTAMSENLSYSLHTLPAELVHCILDNLDQLTILFSIRNVCMRLNAITDNYYRYQVNFIFIFKEEFSFKSCSSKYSCHVDIVQALMNIDYLTKPSVKKCQKKAHKVKSYYVIIIFLQTLTSLDFRVNKIDDQQLERLANILKTNRVRQLFSTMSIIIIVIQYRLSRC